jgi:hypothetical protein
MRPVAIRPMGTDTDEAPSAPSLLTTPMKRTSGEPDSEREGLFSRLLSTSSPVSP